MGLSKTSPTDPCCLFMSLFALILPFSFQSM
ncbi:hypothetical protein OIU77_014096 [Salix suchowensis]|uniref:Uncharacterized protein n=1 Tax=Salix suchowensis TaxID=1278906 RepID=A0ABQ8ZXQ5_9ROSI|nr:hypothetical protein OIU77_014096 [Salix suchowensis]